MKLEFSDDFTAKQSVLDLIKAWKANDQYFPFYSSGTTGPPKQILLPRQLLEWSIAQTNALLALDKIYQLVVLPVERTGGRMQVLRAAENDWSSSFLQPSIDVLSELRNDHSFTLCSLSPAQLQYALDHALQKLDRFDAVLVGGAEIPDSTVEQASGLKHVRLIETYGMTETASHIATRPIGSDWFRPLPGVSLQEEKGQLKASVEHLGLSVLTNDLVEIANGQFRLKGRVDDVINSGGLKIHSAKLEQAIIELFKEMGIERSLCVGKMKNDRFGERPVLCVLGAPFKDENFILDYLKRQLPKHHAPNQIRYLDKLEFTDTGKIKRPKFDA